MRPVLSLKDKRLSKFYDTHAALGVRGEETKFFNLDNFPDNWVCLGVTKVAISGLTISEAIYEYNKELKNVRIIARRKPIRKKVHVS